MTHSSVTGRPAAGSGRQTPEEKALRHPYRFAATHTRGPRRPPGPLQLGDVLTVTGQYDPCHWCRAAMQQAATRMRGRIRRLCRADSCFEPEAPAGRPAARRGTVSRSAEPVVEREAHPERGPCRLDGARGL